MGYLSFSSITFWGMCGHNNH